jgi:dipeptidyl aminopeptidase/acylaminoacyl peptidase
MHGSEDRDVPPAQTLQLAAQLAKTQKEFGVIVFPGGNHILQQHRVERDRQAVEFSRRHLVK